jgi:cytochrome oxidase Cu insertion factor (SCO1/SenC/PrrC family)
MTSDHPDGAIAASPTTSNHTGLPTSMSEAERAAAFATGKAPVDRAAALRAGSVPVPRKFILWIIVGFAVLGLGGIVAEKLIGNAGVGALISSPVTTLAGTGGTGTTGTGSGVTDITAPTTPAPPSGPAISASPSAVIGLIHHAGKTAPAVSLDNQDGAPWSLAEDKGKVVVLTFFNAECDDICPVLAQEITEADRLLGPRRAEVDFVVVNSDPLETSIAPVPPALTQTGLAAVSNVTFLNGSLTDLSSVWKHYGVTVALDNTDRVITHNDIMDFINPAGKLVLGASPFANEDTLGIYSLPPATIHTFAQGVANAATGLVQGAS